MFKEVITGASKKVFSGVKASGSFLGGLALQESLAAVNRRSPRLGGLADKLINHIQAERDLNKIRAASAKNYLESSESDTSKEFKEKVKKEAGPNASSKEIDKNMVVILTKLQKLVDKSGQEEAKKSEFYKSYEKYFEDYKNHEEEAIKESKKSTETKTSSNTTSNTTNNSISDAATQLDNIETNTKDTADAITKLSELPSEEKQKPRVGVREAVSNFGGSVVEKLGDSLVDKLFTPKDKTDEDKVEVKKPENIVSAIENMSTKIVDKLETFATVVKESTENKSQVDVVKNSLPDIDIDLPENKKSSKKNRPNRKQRRANAMTQRSKIDIPERALSPAVESLSTINKAAGISTPSLGSSLVSRFALPALAVAGAGAAGYSVGTMLKGGIDSGISSVVGKEETLGGWLHGKINGDSNAASVAAAKNAVTGAGAAGKINGDSNAASVAAAKNAVTSRAQAALNKQDSVSDKKQTNPAPIIINNTSNGSSGGGSTIITSTPPVRNKESTFERVQMQDFWARAM